MAVEGELGRHQPPNRARWLARVLISFFTGACAVGAGIWALNNADSWKLFAGAAGALWLAGMAIAYLVGAFKNWTEQETEDNSHQFGCLAIVGFVGVIAVIAMLGDLGTIKEKLQQTPWWAFVIIILLWGIYKEMDNRRGG